MGAPSHLRLHFEAFQNDHPAQSLLVRSHTLPAASVSVPGAACECPVMLECYWLLTECRVMLECYWLLTESAE